jgi:hypothetical protein
MRPDPNENRRLAPGRLMNRPLPLSRLMNRRLAPGRLMNRPLPLNRLIRRAGCPNQPSRASGRFSAERHAPISPHASTMLDPWAIVR